MDSNVFNTIEEALEDIKLGRMVVVIDDEQRENEGDLVMAAEKVTPQAVNFMITEGKGLVCVPMQSERLKELQLNCMVSGNTDKYSTAFTVSVDSVTVNTGISAYERAETIKHLVSPDKKVEDFTRPGHLFPLCTAEHGVLERHGHTEAAVDLAKLANLYPAGVICEIVKEDGNMARTPDLFKFARKHNLKIITIAALIKYRRKHEQVMEHVTEANFPTDYGLFKMYGFVHKITGEHHVALVKGDLNASDEPVLSRIHSECLTGDSFGSRKCDCGLQLKHALRKIEEKGRGVLLYMRQEGRGIGLINKIKAYALQDQGLDTVEANHALGFPDDLRDYKICVEMYQQLGVQSVQLMTNNPDKIKHIEEHGMHVERVSIELEYNENNRDYMHTKKKKLGHLLELE